MISKNNFAVIENYLPSIVINQIIELANRKKEEEGSVKLDLQSEQILEKTTRDSKIVWLYDRWLYDFLTPLFHEANKQIGWNFTLNYPEPIQFTKYKENQFYGWHQDVVGVDQNNLSRKLSMVIPLTDSEEYEGGNLEFFDCLQNPSIEKEKAIVTRDSFRKKGSAIIFPSYVYHRVTKVTKGERLSLVIWYKGELWK